MFACFVGNVKRFVGNVKRIAGYVKRFVGTPSLPWNGVLATAAGWQAAGCISTRKPHYCYMRGVISIRGGELSARTHPRDVRERKGSARTLPVSTRRPRAQALVEDNGNTFKLFFDNDYAVSLCTKVGTWSIVASFLVAVSNCTSYHVQSGVKA